MRAILIALIFSTIGFHQAHALCRESMFATKFVEKVEDKLQYLACLHEEQQRTIEEMQITIQDLELRLSEAESKLDDLN